MTLHNIAVAAKDGAGSSITGGIRQHDTSGTAAGPNVPEIIVVDSTGAEVIGTTADAAVTTNTTGTVIGFLRGIVSLLVSGITVASHAVTNAGTFAVQSTLQAGTALIGIVKIGDGTNTATVKAASTAAVATDTALVVAISPNSSGSLAQGSTTSGQTGALIQGAVTTAAPAYTTAQTSPLSLDVAGNLRVVTGSDVAAANLVTGAITTAMTGTTTTSLVAAPGASLHNMITQVTVSNSHATIGTDIVLQDGSGGTALYTIPAAANYGGATITFNPPLRQPSANTALFVANVTTGASTKVSANGFKAA